MTVKILWNGQTEPEVVHRYVESFSLPIPKKLYNSRKPENFGFSSLIGVYLLRCHLNMLTFTAFCVPVFFTFPCMSAASTVLYPRVIRNSDIFSFSSPEITILSNA